MLVVRRKKNESILIGEDIEIKIVNLENGTVQIGIEAPKELSIIRKEILKDVADENKAATNVNLDILKNLKLK